MNKGPTEFSIEINMPDGVVQDVPSDDRPLTPQEQEEFSNIVLRSIQELRNAGDQNESMSFLAQHFRSSASGDAAMALVGLIGSDSMDPGRYRRFVQKLQEGSQMMQWLSQEPIVLDRDNLTEVVVRDIEDIIDKAITSIEELNINFGDIDDLKKTASIRYPAIIGGHLIDEDVGIVDKQECAATLLYCEKFLDYTEFRKAFELIVSLPIEK